MAAALLLIIAAPANAAPADRVEARLVMGTMAEVRTWSADPAVARAACDSAFAVCVRLDSLLSTWNGNSPLSRLNRLPAGTWGDLGPEGARVVAAALDVARRSGGAFDPTVLPLVKLWGFRGGVPGLPEAADLERTRALVDHAAVSVDTVAGQVRLGREGMALDLGGVAKGYALDRAVAAALAAGADGVVVDLGGSLAVGGDGPGAAVAVVDPAAPDRIAFTVPLQAGSVATSGQYERFVEIDGRRYGHLLDPRTGRPIPPQMAVTVLAPTGLLADALATAAAVLGPECGWTLLESWPGVEGVVVGASGARTTSGLVTGAP